MLTRRQAQALRFIDEQQRATGVTPSYAEISLGIGLRSKSGAARVIGALEARGFVRKLHHCARSIEIVRITSYTDRDPVQRERERCARIADGLARHSEADSNTAKTARLIAENIRSGVHFPPPPKSDT